MADDKPFLESAVADSKVEVRKWLARTASELRAVADHIENTGDLLDGGTNSAAIVANEVGRAMRQPFGQNAQEFLLRELANLSYWQGALMGESRKDAVV